MSAKNETFFGAIVWGLGAEILGCIVGAIFSLIGAAC